MKNFSGVGSGRDNELQGGSRQNARTFNMGINPERTMIPLGLNKNIRHTDFAPGDLVSLEGKKIVPLDPLLGFAGILENVGEDTRGYVATVTTRGAIVVRVTGLSPETRQGAKVFALSGKRSEFRLEEPGVLVGEICAVENLETGRAVVGIRLPADARRFELGGPRPSNSGQYHL